MSLNRLAKLLRPAAGNPLGELIRRARATDELTLVLRRALAADAAKHLVSANLRDDGELVLVCSSPAWASRLRYESEAMLQALRQHGARADRCRVKVATKKT
jgi:hypothetical protein